MQAQFTVVETATFTKPLDHTDVMTVQNRDLAHALRVLIDNGNALVLVNGADDATRANIEAAFWRSFKGPARVGGAILLRFWALVDVMGHKRLNTMFFNRGYAMVEHLAVAASVQRLNITWGFNPQRILSAVLAGEVAAAAATSVITHRAA